MNVNPTTRHPRAADLRRRRVRRSACRLGLAVALLAVLRTAAAAPDLDALTGATLDLASAAQQSLADDRVPLYVAGSPDATLLRDLLVQIDDAAPVRYQFSEVEARALRSGGLKRMLSLTPGSHRLYAEFVARADDGKPGATRYSARLQQDLVVAGQAWTLQFTTGGMLRSAQLALQPAAGDAALHEADYLLASDRPFEAALRLHGLAVDAERQAAVAQALASSADAAEEDSMQAISRYNSAVTAAAGSDAAALDAIGAADAKSVEALAVRDLANVTAGYRDLQSGQADMAMQHFRQVRSPGPYSNAAMLGLGWCYLWPRAAATADAVALRPQGADAIAATRRQTPFRYLQAVAADARAEDLRRALIPWAELLGRDPLDPAVQEGMLAIPYALDHFGAHAQAQQYYERALNTLDSARATLTAARRQIGDGSVLAAIDQRDADTGSGWPRLLVEQRDDVHAVPLRVLAADAGVAPALRDYRLLRAQERTLEALAAASRAAGRNDLLARLDAQRAQLTPAREAAAARTQTAMLAALQALDRQTVTYLAEAEFAMARVYDRESHGDGR